MIKFILIRGLGFIGLLSFFISCDSAESEYVTIPQTPVVIDLTQVPYPKLSDYNFFDGVLKNLSPSYGVIPYKPITELFTDYAEKKRFIWMPNGQKATYTNDASILNLPVGAVLIKVFYYNNVQPNNITHIIETRLMIRKDTGWIFAEYIWNAEQTEAYLETAGTTRPISWRDADNVIQTIDYKTPAVATDCFRCHGTIFTETKNPIGIKPQNLNSNFNYADGVKNQLTKLVEFGYLENTLPSTINTVVDYKDVTKSLDLRVRSYFDANCAHCHSDGGESDHFVLRYAFNETTDPEKMGVGLQGEHVLAGYNGRIVSSGNVGQSILHYRVQTQTDLTYIMPPLGRSIKHKEGVQLIEDWINSL